MAPGFARAASITGRARLAKVNADLAQDLSGRFAIRSIPATLLPNEGREASGATGARTAAQLERWITRA